MHIGIVCKIIDNLGDAGFSLRLARALATKNHQVVLFHHDDATLSALYPVSQHPNLFLINTLRPEFDAHHFTLLDLVLEPFGTSSEQTELRFDLELKRACPTTPWLLIDYLSAESWVEKFHLLSSVSPATGHKTTYFYPGFTRNTGGVIHCDYPEQLRQLAERPVDSNLRLFVFSYPAAPLDDLLKWADEQCAQGRMTEVALAGSHQVSRQIGSMGGNMGGVPRYLPFCPQSEFDDLLAEHDILFVRGEDSFVRAQLAGKPLIWQIYPTLDGAHADKLIHFFKRYSEKLTEDCSRALWDCWASWNQLDGCSVFSSCWVALLPHLPELRSNAQAWRETLFSGPELVKEVLTWRSVQPPTFTKKTD